MPTVKVSQVDEHSTPPTGRVWWSVGFQALDGLINEQLLLEVAKDEGVLPTDQDIQKDLEFHQKQDPDYMKKREVGGSGTQEIKDQLKLELATFNIVTKGITVTSADAKKFIEEHPNTFTTPAQADLLYIVVNDDKSKQSADRDLASGQSFSQVAERYSIDPNVRSSHGKYQQTVIAQMSPALQDLVNSTPELKTTDWKKDKEQWVKFYVEKKLAAKKLPVDDTLTEAVRRDMAVRKGSQSMNLNKMVFDKMTQAKIQVMDSGLQGLWNEYLKQAKQSVSSNNPPAKQPGAPSANPSAPAKP